MGVPIPPRTMIALEDLPGAPQWVRPLLERTNAFSRPVTDALSHGLTFAENFSGEVVDVRLVPPVDWIPISFASGWAQWVDANYPKCSFRKDDLGNVTARGLVDNTGAGDYLTLFAGGSPYTPPAGEWVIHPTSANGSFGSLIVNSTGIMYLAGDKTRWHSLDSLRWVAADRSPLRWSRPVDVVLGKNGRKFPGKPGFVLPLSVIRVDGKPTTADVLSIGWDPILVDVKDGTQGIRIYRLTGLQPGVAYIVTLLILPE